MGLCSTNCSLCEVLNFAKIVIGPEYLGLAVF
jgi:hypothetical protein